MTLRDLPQVDALSKIAELAEFPESVRIRAARHAIQIARQNLLDGGSRVDLTAEAVRAATQASKSGLQQVLNMSGVLLHTGLGRAVLSADAAERMRIAAANPVELEVDLDSGERGDRQDHIRGLLTSLTGAEDALVVNNAAAGVVLALAAIAKGKQVLLSRGEMIEIGGSFRMPEILAQSGCQLVEIGTTNKTRLSDYEAMLGPETGAMLKCQPSNYRVVGFQQSADMKELGVMGLRRRIPLIHDQGNGCLIDMQRFGLPAESTFRDSVEAGATITIASGDKLMGGPQAGVVVGDAGAITLMKNHPLARAFRIDKVSLAGLVATLECFAENRVDEIPLYRSLGRSLDWCRAVAIRLCPSLSPQAEPIESVTEVGSGTVPGTGVPTWCVGLEAPSIHEIARKLRLAPLPIVGRVAQGRLLLDVRGLSDDEIELAEETLRNLNFLRES